MLPARGEKREKVGNWTEVVRKGEGKLEVLSASLPLLAQEDP